MPVGHLYVFFEKISIHIFCPFFKCVVCFSDVELYKFFVYFEYWSFIVYIFCEYFLLFSRLFILLVVVSCPVKSFLVWYSPVCSFCSPLVSWGDILKNIAKTTVKWALLPLFSSGSFIALGLTFKSWIDFSIYFCIWCEKEVQFDSFPCGCPFPTTMYWRGCLFPIVYPPSLSYITWPWTLGFGTTLAVVFFRSLCLCLY